MPRGKGPDLEAEKRAVEAGKKILAEEDKRLVVAQDIPEERPMARLLTKLEAWLAQQPEWPHVFLADRNIRRQVSREIAHRLMTLPKRGDEERRGPVRQ